jgi:hypothetical protein
VAIKLISLNQVLDRNSNRLGLFVAGHFVHGAQAQEASLVISRVFQAYYLARLTQASTRAQVIRLIVKIEGVFSGSMRDISNEFSTRQPDGLAFSSVVKIARNEGHTLSIVCSGTATRR